ncbi:bone marrow proteoglycan [Tupaia chinensis]|uniref:bone marrow proteoglycan n=1 Tax=Tupaia chinensis TaxID=246437 RepID=UPI0003C8EFDD|nr:bone marrow proteoglycan [Tupaia chinensis]XP_027632526.1 bone marrow proteoglycan [Tupaia chinensis]
MELPLFLALLCGAVSALHLRTETSHVENFLGDETLLQDKVMSEQEAPETSPGELRLLEEEEEGGSGSEGAPEEEGAVEPVSALDVVEKDLQCPKEDDVVTLVGSPGCKTCRYLLVRSPRSFTHAQNTCRTCYRGNLVSIHSFNINFRIQSTVRVLNQAQIWIGGLITGSGSCRRFQWVDGSSWNFAFWASGQPWSRGGACVTLCTKGGHWRRAECSRTLPFVCSY